MNYIIIRKHFFNFSITFPKDWVVEIVHDSSSVSKTAFKFDKFDQTDSTNGFKTPKQRLESSLNNAEDCESHNYLNVLFKFAH